MGKIELKVEVDEALLRRAEARGITPEAMVQEAVREYVDKPTFDLVAAARRQAADPAGAERRARQWAQENAEAIKAYNERIARRGLFGDDLRRW